MHKLLPFIILASLLLTGGCNKNYVNTNSTANYTPAAVQYSLDLPRKDIKSTKALLATLTHFRNTHESVSGTTVTVTPSKVAGTVSASAVRQALMRVGFAKQAITVAAPDKLLRHTTVTLHGYTIVPPRQNTWEYPAPTMEIYNSSVTDGSSVNANIGAMIAIPKNSVVPHELAPADGMYHQNVIEHYRGTITTSDDSKNNNSSNSNNSSSSNQNNNGGQ